MFNEAASAVALLAPVPGQGSRGGGFQATWEGPALWERHRA
jgi:hypothetical protein